MALEDIKLSESLASQIKSIIDSTTANAKIGSGTTVEIHLRHEVDCNDQDDDRVDIRVEVTPPVVLSGDQSVPGSEPKVASVTPQFDIGAIAGALEQMSSFVNKRD